MKHLIAFLFAASLLAQAPAGTVAQSTTSVITGTAGGVICTLTNTTPALPSGIHIVCTSGGAMVLTLDSVVPTGTNGLAGSFGLSGNTITWLINQPTGQTAYSWQMGANGTAKSGTF